MQDRVIAYNLERASSTDFNVAQQIQARRLADIDGRQHAELPAPIGLDNAGGITPVDMRTGAVISGLQVYHNGTTTGVRVGPGSLTQFEPAQLTPCSPLSPFQTGFVRGAITVPYISTAGLGLDLNAHGAYHLLCCRLIEYISATGIVEIFDVATQQFVLTPVTKRTELFIEFKWVLGGAGTAQETVWPALNSGGATWEPLAYVSFVHPDGTENNARVIDVARRVEGRTTGWSDPGFVGTGALALGAELTGYLSSMRSPDTLDAAGGALVGRCAGTVNCERALFQSSADHRQGTVPDANDGSAPTDWTLVHYYLAPLVAGGLVRWPLRARSTDEDPTWSHVARGLIVGSTVQPTRRRTNSATLHLFESGGVPGRYANQGAIDPGMAIYLGSGHSFGVQGFNVIYPMTRSRGGSVLYPFGEENQYIVGAPSIRWLCPFVALIPGNAAAVGAFLEVINLDLSNIVPRTATAVYLLFEMLGDTNYTGIYAEVRNRVDSAANSITPKRAGHSANAGQRLAAGNLAGGGYESDTHTPYVHSSCVLRVPVGWGPALGHGDATVAPIEGYHFRLVAAIASLDAAGTRYGATSIRCVGWDE